MSINTILKKTILASALIAVTAMAQTPYDDGQKALREKEWTAAVEYFEQAIETGEKDTDAAMYWRAYALYEAKRDREAERQIRKLERSYPDSRWLKEAQVLQIEHGASPELVAGTDNVMEDEELRMFALAQLMDRDPDRALPLVLEELKTSESEEYRADTLFMLGMSDDPRAQQAIAEFARDSKNPGLQADAINMLGIASNKESMALLADLYRESGSDQVKEAVINAFIVSDYSKPLAELLKAEKDPKLQIEIIHAMGVMDATDELQALYPTLSSQETKVATLEAFFIAGDSGVLRQVLESETDPELRKTAIEGIAINDDKGAADLLESIYQNATTTEKKAVLEALVMMDEGEDLALKIVRTESDPELRGQAIHVLGINEATTELAELYQSIHEPDLRKMVLEALMIADDTDGLIKVLQSEQDPEMRSSAIEMLAVSGDRKSGQYLVSIYPDVSRDEKESIIEAMMIMDDASGLIGLLKTETDAALKREMMQKLSLMDSDEADQYLFELLEKK
ncbi:MAG: HEAT repeat domain-containing protein [Xanthomonadales bacterium]|nr:HEAT repeat domain-containing protein [Xanthomonadales bacterium]